MAAKVPVTGSRVILAAYLLFIILMGDTPPPTRPEDN